MKIYTKTGDDGTTGLFNGSRVPKSHLRVESYGTVDELNSIIGLVTTYELNDALKNPLRYINSKLFTLGSDLATPIEPPAKFEIIRINIDDINWLECEIDKMTSQLPPLRNFILPGGTRIAGLLHLARTVCRRAERIAVELSGYEQLGDYIIKYLNRLSDYLFTAARYANFLAAVEDEKWNG